MLKLSSFIFTLLFSVPLFCINKNDTFESIKDKYKNVESIYIEFYMNNQPKSIGKVTAKKGNKYKIDFQNRLIFCNGKTLWNYSKSDNKVLISNFKELQNISLEKLFFSEMKESTPIELSKINTNNENKAWELELKNTKTNMLYNLYLNSNYDIVSIKILDYKQEWFIKQIEVNKSNKENFDFNISDKMEVIDLR